MISNLCTMFVCLMLVIGKYLCALWKKNVIFNCWKFYGKRSFLWKNNVWRKWKESFQNSLSAHFISDFLSVAFLGAPPHEIPIWISYQKNHTVPGHGSTAPSLFPQKSVSRRTIAESIFGCFFITKTFFCNENFGNFFH